MLLGINAIATRNIVSISAIFAYELFTASIRLTADYILSTYTREVGVCISQIEIHMGYSGRDVYGGIKLQIRYDNNKIVRCVVDAPSEINIDDYIIFIKGRISGKVICIENKNCIIRI